MFIPVCPMFILLILLFFRFIIYNLLATLFSGLEDFIQMLLSYLSQFLLFFMHLLELYVSEIAPIPLMSLRIFVFDF